MHNILSHPFYPTTLELDGYTPLVADFTFILGVFFVSVATVGLGTWFISGIERFKLLDEKHVESVVVLLDLCGFGNCLHSHTHTHTKKRTGK